MTRMQARTLLGALLALLWLGGAAAQGMDDEAVMGHGDARLYRFADEGEIGRAWSKLVRTDAGVAMELHTRELEPDGAYTVWWVVFNDPGACSADPNGDPAVPLCGEDDIFTPEGSLGANPLARVSILYATGNLAPASGEGHFSAFLPVGRTFGEVVYGRGLEDAYAAEVHLVVRAHGPMNPDRLWVQLNTFEPDVAMGGACEACRDLQFAIHLPDSAGRTVATAP